MSDSYIALVWAQDAGKFAKDFLDAKKLSCNIESVLVLGSEIKTDDLKQLEQLTLPFFIDNSYAGEKRDTEIFVLGRMFEAGKGLVAYTPLQKDAQEVAKKAGLTAITWAAACKGGTTSKQSVRTKPPKQTDKPPVEKPPVEKQPEEKKAKTASNLKPVRATSQKESPANKKSEEVSGQVKRMSADSPLIPIIQESKLLTDNEKKQLLSPGNLALIESAIKKSADATKGLSFQLTLHLPSMLGINADKYAKVFENKFLSLKKALEE